MIGICGRGITFSVCSLLGVLGSSDKSHLNRLYCLQINIQCFLFVWFRFLLSFCLFIIFFIIIFICLFIVSFFNVYGFINHNWQRKSKSWLEYSLATLEVQKICSFLPVRRLFPTQFPPIWPRKRDSKQNISCFCYNSVTVVILNIFHFLLVTI